MYSRKTKQRNGRIYLAILHGYRDENGVTRNKTIKSLGYPDELMHKCQTWFVSEEKSVRLALNL